VTLALVIARGCGAGVALFGTTSKRFVGDAGRNAIRRVL
jgi:hypothetical protein